MPKPRVDSGGGPAAIRYSLEKAREAKSVYALYRRLRSRNACKTCALGMGGQRGGMVDEAGHFPEVCKKSIQAQVGDMQEPIHEGFFRRHSIEELRSWSPWRMERAGRLVFPIRADAGDSHFRRITWGEALETLGDALRSSSPEETFFYASGRSSNEAAFLLHTVARAFGTRNIHNCSSYCHQASGVALGQLLGSGTATVVLEDIDRTDLVVIAGANPASNHPRLITRLVELRRRGGRVVVINPLKELGLVRFRIPSRVSSLLRGSQVSDLYLQPRVGTDIALFKAMLKGLVERDALDRSFISRHVDGWDAVERDARAASWSELLGICGVERDRVERAIDLFAGAERAILCWAMGLTHHEYGVDNVHALANLAVARGWIGRPGAGLLPLRGHSNVQGVGSVGFTPVLKARFAERMASFYGFPVNTEERGLDTYGSLAAAHEGRMRVAVLLGGNLYGSSPDLAWASEALGRVGTTCYLTTKLNPGHVHGAGRTNLVLPVLARDEERQPTTQESMFNYVRLSDGGLPAPGPEVKGEVEVVCALAARVLPPGPFPFDAMTDHRKIRQAIAAVVPGYGAIGRIDDTKEEFQIEGRTFHEARFATANGRLRARVVRVPERSGLEGRFMLTTLRSEGQFNTVVYEEEDLYRGVQGRQVVMMNEADARALGLAEGDRVRVASEAGSMEARVAYVDLPRGDVAMYFPEANRIVPRRLDPASGTPAFKSVPVEVKGIAG